MCGIWGGVGEEEGRGEGKESTTRELMQSERQTTPYKATSRHASANAWGNSLDLKKRDEDC